MSIENGKIRITKEINRYNDDLTFFKFKQNKNEYYCLSVELLNEREGFLAFSLPKKLDDLFEKGDFSVKALYDLFKEKVDNFYFLSFQDEDAETQIIEYVGSMDKTDVLKIYNIG